MAALVVTIVPTVELPPAIPFTLHVTPDAPLPVPEILTVNTCSLSVGVLTAVGATITTISSVKLTVAEALACLSAWLTAVTVTLGDDGNVAGAV